MQRPHVHFKRRIEPERAVEVGDVGVLRILFPGNVDVSAKVRHPGLEVLEWVVEGNLVPHFWPRNGVNVYRVACVALRWFRLKPVWEMPGVCCGWSDGPLKTLVSGLEVHRTERRIECKP